MTIDPEWLGMVAAFFTTASYIPQAIKILRYKQTEALSLGMYIMLTLGIFFWFIYGVMLGSASLMIANGITVILSAAILVMKIRYR
ncbi:MAG: SemiSWEET transporter [Alphaproteobacteria bacterium]|nr:SemiSWEET transporter [Alphaproteobacteria bacterium]